MTAANDDSKPVRIDQEYIQKLAKLPEYGYEQVRGSFASGLGVRKSYLDAEVKKYKDSIEKERLSYK